MKISLERLFGTRTPRRKLAARALLVALVVVIVVALGGFVRVDRGMVRRFEARAASFPSRVYSAPLTLRRGARIDPTALLAQLQRREYAEVSTEPAEPGQFSRKGNDWRIFVRAADTPDGRRAAALLELDVTWGKLRRIGVANTGMRLEATALEPEVLFTFYADLHEERRLTRLDEIPEALRQAVEAIEDRRFRRHLGVDLIGIGRAAMTNLRAGGVVQGGSTITQQLAKNLHGPGRRTFTRKALEAVGAIALELHYDKDQILEAYLNEVYLGQTGPVAISGVGEASRFHFGVEVGELDLARCALLAGMIRNPGRYNPRRHPEEARARRDVVLNVMQQSGLIDAEAHRRATTSSLDTAAIGSETTRFPWIEDYLAREIRRIAPEAIPSRAGFSIFTTFDPAVQRASSQALQRGLARLEQRIGTATDGGPLEGAIVVLRPSDGALLALVGGRDYRKSQFNRAVSALRSPGSTFKPFVFLAGFERSLRDSDFHFTAATLLDDEPLELPASGGTWSPANYDGAFRGTVTVRDALEKSINVPTVRAALEIGLPEIVDAAHRCGIDSPLEPIPSLALGTKEVTPLEMAVAYATFANGGFRVSEHGIRGLTDRHGNPHSAPDRTRTRVLEPEVAYLVTNLLEGVMQRGTGRTSASLGFDGRAAGKTGSSDSLRDGWFIGFTGDLLALVWVGYDDNRPIGLPGGSAALPIWVDLLQTIGAPEDPLLARPRGIVTVDIDPTTGGLQARGCPHVVSEIFLAGTQPEQRCELHGGKKRRKFWRRLFDRDS